VGSGEKISPSQRGRSGEENLIKFSLQIGAFLFFMYFYVFLMGSKLRASTDHVYDFVSIWTANENDTNEQPRAAILFLRPHLADYGCHHDQH